MSAFALAVMLVSVPASGAPPADEVAVRRLYEDEPDFERDWPVEFHIRVVEPHVEQLAHAFLNLADGAFLEHFEPTVAFGWGAPPDHDFEALPMNATRREWQMSPALVVPATQVAAEFARYAGAFEFLERTKIKIKTGVVKSKKTHFSAVAAMHFAGRGTDGLWRDDHGKVELDFHRTAAGWKIDRFVLQSFTTDTSERRHFEDVTQHWLRDVPEEARSRLVAKSASDYIFDQIQKNEMPAGSRAQPVAMDAHPGVVVVDIDRDGFDDLFVWDVLGDAVLLRNVDGTSFEDKTAALGFDVDKVSGAAFADLDHDGFVDAVIAGWYRRSRIFFGGAEGFVDAKLSLPAEVATVSIADVNADGRLDVFFGTAAHDHHAKTIAADPTIDGDANVNQIGPANLLLVNLRGRRFADGTKRMGLELRRNTLQASFADIDDDGAVDVFIGNDFAPGNLFLNRQGRFVDVSASTHADQILFGMGATWGDIDGDGDLDLYASAMASSAGKRIMAGPNISRDLTSDDLARRHQAARGNTLLENLGEGRFDDASARPSFAATRSIGWSYGSQLIDVDNDGWLDVYAPSGFFTSPLADRGAAYRDL